MDDVKFVLCNYKTKDLTQRAILSIREYYPEANITVVDGSDYDESTEWLLFFAMEDGNMTVYTHTFNIHHGPGMDMAIRASEKPYVFVMDTDAYIVKRKVVEDMLKLTKDKEWHSVGKLMYVSKGGMKSAVNRRTIKEPYKYIHPFASLINRDVYIQHSPFIRHGAPCIDVSIDLHNKGKSDLLIELSNVNQYVKHDWKGTRDKYGIQL